MVLGLALREADDMWDGKFHMKVLFCIVAWRMEQDVAVGVVHRILQLEVLFILGLSLGLNIRMGLVHGVGRRDHVHGVRLLFHRQSRIVGKRLWKRKPGVCRAARIANVGHPWA